jgi:curli production assembly/transport component CsgF
MRHQTAYPASACLLGLLLATALPAPASELVYAPVNPNFGGNPLNGSYLLNNAEAQNKYKDSSARSRSAFKTPTALDRFVSSLESRLLSELLNDISAGNTGSLHTDLFDILITQDPDSGELLIQITDNQTGEITEITVGGLVP